MLNCNITKPRLKIAPEEIRRAAQNSLYWRTLTDIQETKVNAISGNLKEWWHDKFKRDFLINIYIRDDSSNIDGKINLTGYALMFSQLEIVLQQCGKATYDNLVNSIIKETSTTRATVKQFSEYLTCIFRYCRENGVFLTIDRDLMDLADIPYIYQDSNSIPSEYHHF